MSLRFRTWGWRAIGASVTGLALTAAGPGPAQAQTQTMYRCKGSNGTPVLSDRPCAGDPLPSTQVPDRALPNPPLGYHDPDPYRRRSRQVDRYSVPQYYEYLSAGCRQLHDAIRTAPTRGLSYATIGELQKEWAQKCHEDVDLAIRQMEMQRLQAVTARRREEQALQAQREAEAQRQAQCGEMRLALKQRRERLDSMTPGERGDFERFERNYAERCGS